MRICLFPLLPVLAALVLAGCAPKQTNVNPKDLATNASNSWEVNYSVMQAGERTGNLDVAINAGLDELDNRPDNDECRIMLARLQSRAGRPEQAQTTLEGVSPERAVSPEARVEQARIYVASDNAALALNTLNALEGAEGAVGREARKLTAVSQDLIGDHVAAQSMYRQLLTEREESSVRFNYGRSLVATRDFKNAAATLLPLVDDPDYARARILCAGAMMKAGEKAAARSLLEGYLSPAEIDQLMQEK